MRVAALEVFDDIINGTGTYWYTPAHLNEQLGTDVFAIQAVASQISSAAPGLWVELQTSANGVDWYTYGGPLISATLANDGSYWGSGGGLFIPILTMVRFRISLGGTNPSCRLKLYFTGRAYTAAGRAGGSAGHPSPGNFR